MHPTSGESRPVEWMVPERLADAVDAAAAAISRASGRPCSAGAAVVMIIDGSLRARENELADPRGEPDTTSELPCPPDDD